MTARTAPTATTTSNPTVDLAAREAEAGRAVADALAERDRLRDLADAADEAVRLSEVAALNAEKARVFGELRQARDAAETRYATVVRNPKATLLQLAQAHLDRCEAGTVIEVERREINDALDVLDPQYRNMPAVHGERVGVRRQVPRENTARVAYENPLATLDDVLFEWATNVTTNTTVADAARARQARVSAARDAAREAALTGVTASS